MIMKSDHPAYPSFQKKEPEGSCRRAGTFFNEFPNFHYYDSILMIECQGYGYRVICSTGKFLEKTSGRILSGTMYSRKRFVMTNSIYKIKKSAPCGPVMPELIASQRGASRTTRNGLTAHYYDKMLLAECQEHEKGRKKPAVEKRGVK